MKEEIFKCGKCERDFRSKDALKMHDSTKHSSNIPKEKTAKKDIKKIRNWAVFLIAAGLIFYGIFWIFGNVNSVAINGGDLNFNAPIGEIHWHPILTIKINDEIQEIPENIGITSSVHFPTHTHEDANIGVIHMENNNPTRKTVTLGYFFEVWGKKFNKDCIFNYCIDKGELKMYVNGEENLDFEKYFMQDADDILIEYNSFN